MLEHGVDQPHFLAEAHRILKPGGQLILSTDFWYERLAPKSSLFGASDAVFAPDDIERFLELARTAGFEVPEVSWPESKGPPIIEFGDLSYTFLFLSMRKPA